MHRISEWIPHIQPQPMVVQLTIWVWRSEGCRAAHAQLDNKGFSTPLWGRSTRASIFTAEHTHTHYIQADVSILQVSVKQQQVRLSSQEEWVKTLQICSYVTVITASLPFLPLTTSHIVVHTVRISSFLAIIRSLQHSLRLTKVSHVLCSCRPALSGTLPFNSNNHNAAIRCSLEGPWLQVRAIH